MKAITAKEMKALDQRAIQGFGILGLVLMENAGRGVADLIDSQNNGKCVVIFSGKGNNGGDGFVVARHLHNRGFRVQVFLLARANELKGDAATNYQIISKMKLPIKEVTDQTPERELSEAISNADSLVDALFGIGLSKPLQGVDQSVVSLMNASGKAIVAVDIPSGLDADTGEVLGACVKARVTATLGLAKKGLYKGQGPEMAGKVAVIDIGLPKA